MWVCHWCVLVSVTYLLLAVLFLSHSGVQEFSIILVPVFMTRAPVWCHFYKFSALWQLLWLPFWCFLQMVVEKKRKKHWPDSSINFSLSWDSVSNANNANAGELFGTVGLRFCILNAFLLIECNNWHLLWNSIQYNHSYHIIWSALEFVGN